jgi:hypothetical protein
VVQGVDLAEVVAVGGDLPLEAVDVDLQPQGIRVLVGLERHRPEREEEGERDRDDRHDEQRPCPAGERLLEEPLV